MHVSAILQVSLDCITLHIIIHVLVPRIPQECKKIYEHTFVATKLNKQGCKFVMMDVLH